MKFPTLFGSQLAGCQVLLRVDFNVPLDESGNITDDTRIKQSIPTIQFILDAGASIVLMSHLGRPDGEVVPSLSLAPVAKRLSELLGMPVQMAPDCVGDLVKKMAAKLQPKEILLLENLRFHVGEQDSKKYPQFAKELAKLGNFYVNDAFGTSHRQDASMYVLPTMFDHVAAGFVVEKEALVLSNLLTQSQKPFTAIIAGSKVSSKIGIIEALLGKIDNLLIGGAMAFTFLKVQGHNVGNSLVDDAHLDTAKQVIKRCRSQNVQLYLPTDCVIATQLTHDAETKVVSMEGDGILHDYIGADIGPDTIGKWEEIIRESKTIFWNGPMGVFEKEPFRKGTQKIAVAIAESSAISIAGGGDSLAAIKMAGVDKRITHVSTGGGASLEFVERGTLDALEALVK